MTTRQTVSLMWETDSPTEPDKKVWRKLGYTHAKSYEEALDRLLPKLSNHRGMSFEDNYFLVWGFSPKYENITDVTPAVVYRLRKNYERLFKIQMKTKTEDIPHST
jgi:hypothetical protein